MKRHWKVQINLNGLPNTSKAWQGCMSNKKERRIPSNSNYILTKINWMLVTKQISIPRKMKYVICLCDCECTLMRPES